MAILRNEISKNFTIISNYPLFDYSLSLKAIGMYAKLSSLPDDWKFTEEGLSGICKDGSTSVKSALQELENNNLLFRFRKRNIDGTLGESIYYIASRPMTEEEKKEIISRYNPREAFVLNKIESENPIIESPRLENPMLGSEAQLNTNILNTNILNTKNLKENTKENFETFYNAYPRKVGKANVEKWFIKNKPREELFDLMMKKLELFKKSPDWLKDNGQFIPYPATWLNQKRWEDEIYINGLPIEQPNEEKYVEIDTSNMSDEEYARTLRERRRRNEGK